MEDDGVNVLKSIIMILNLAGATAGLFWLGYWCFCRKTKIRKVRNALWFTLVLIVVVVMYCPNATVHLQLIPWGWEEMIYYETVNEWVREAYAHYREKGEERVLLIDTFTAIGRNTDEHCIHLDYQGNENWYKAILAHAEANGLAQ